MILQSHLFSDFGEAHGKNLLFFSLHIFSFSGIETKERARRAYWAVSGKHIPLPNNEKKQWKHTHTKQKPTFTRFFFYSICLAVIYRRPLKWDCLRKKSKGHFSIHLKGKCHKKTKQKNHKHNRVLHLLRSALSCNCTRHLKIACFQLIFPTFRRH